MNGQYYANLLAQAREAVVQKRRGKLSRGVLFLQDNASVHTARVSRQALKDTGFSEIHHPPYSPDLAPSDYFLFSNLKKELRGRRFVDDNQMKMAVESHFEGIFFGRFEGVIHQIKKAINGYGYVVRRPRLMDEAVSSHTRLGWMIHGHTPKTKDSEFEIAYSEQIQRLFKKDYAEPIKEEDEISDRAWYLPHFAVQNPHKPGKYRIVLDAEDQPALMFLWRDRDWSKPPKKYKLTSLFLELTALHFFLAHSVRDKNAMQHENEYLEAAKAIVTCIYMDDYLDSMDTSSEAIGRAKTIKKIPEDVKFNL
ncbi:Histone-lysine N-methyltransferase SETMAR [Eumeta japonica]|uniref:Histone-lysine N-methyltransferase SETMAR n=1 Tax=Eumeta variegata TaxID=151549 RepID=A0A4C1TKZ0_EUMVA|nr:Histone-lysine N-methyltransferase SETMAR [Eumeta japonica]